jgi:hypothetical protein
MRKTVVHTYSGTPFLGGGDRWIAAEAERIHGGPDACRPIVGGGARLRENNGVAVDITILGGKEK